MLSHGVSGGGCGRRLGTRTWDPLGNCLLPPLPKSLSHLTSDHRPPREALGPGSPGTSFLPPPLAGAAGGPAPRGVTSLGPTAMDHPIPQSSLGSGLGGDSAGSCPVLPSPSQHHEDAVRAAGAPEESRLMKGTRTFLCLSLGGRGGGGRTRGAHARDTASTRGRLGTQLFPPETGQSAAHTRHDQIRLGPDLASALCPPPLPAGSHRSRERRM